MTKSKINYLQIVFLIFSFFVLGLIILQPDLYLGAISHGIMVWATIILPGLIPFMFLSKIMQVMPYTYTCCSLLGKVNQKCFSVPNITGYIYFMSVLSGYPLGAKLTKDFFDSGHLSLAQAKKVITFCSTSGPIFMIGSIGASLLSSYASGVIIFCSNILGSFFNGLLFRGKKEKITISSQFTPPPSRDILSDSMYSTVLSSLFVGGFIAMAFLLVEILSHLNIINLVGSLLNNTIFLGKLNIGGQIVSGLIEVTRGCLELSQSSLSLQVKTILASGIIAFGGLSVHLQCMGFLSSIGIKYSYFLKTKLAHTLITVVLAIIFSIIFL